MTVTLVRPLVFKEYVKWMGTVDSIELKNDIKDDLYQPLFEHFRRDML